MDNKHRAMLFFGVMFFAFLVSTAYFTSAAYDAALGAATFQENQLNKAKMCSNNCDKLVESGTLNCDWIECSEKCQVGAPTPYCAELS